jgi:RNA polymerase primary sigma factor
MRVLYPIRENKMPNLRQEYPSKHAYDFGGIYFERKYEKLTKREEAALIEKAKKDDDAKNEFIGRNMGLLVYVSRQYHNNGLDFEDLVQEGSIGFLTALNKFNPKKKCKFSTYATIWIKQSIRRALDTKSRQIYLPTNVISKMRQYQNIISEYNIRGEEPDEKKITAKLKISSDQLKRLQRASSLSTTSLDRLVSDENDRPQYQYEDNKTLKTIYDSLLRGEIKREIISSEKQKKLTEKEAKVIRLRFGLENGLEHTLAQVGKELNLTRERIRQLQNKAIKKLRKRMLLRISVSNSPTLRSYFFPAEHKTSSA